MKYQKIIIIVLLLGWSSLLMCQDQPELNVHKISDNLSVISGVGGNIAVLSDKDGLLVVDAGVRRAGALLKEKIQKLFKLPVKTLINTHYHQDHTGGNKAIAEGADVVAHDNCKATMKRLAGEAAKTEKGKKTLKDFLLPQISYDKMMDIHFGDEQLMLIHFGPGHTSGDTVVVFKKNRVVHTGDLFFYNIAPYIDVLDGSDTGNWIKTIKKITTKFPDYKVIPGHGELTDMKEFLHFSEYLQFLRDSVKKGIAEGKNSKEIQESTSFKDFPQIREKGSFMTKKNNLDWVYQEMTREKK